VWVPDPEEGFILGQVVDLGLGEVTVQPVDPSRKKTVTCSLDRTYSADYYDTKDVDDNCKLHTYPLPPCGWKGIVLLMNKQKTARF